MREGEEALAAAEKLLNQRRLPEAVDLLSPWVEEHPDHACAWELLAAAQLQQQAWAYVEQAARQGVRLTATSVSDEG